MNVVLNIFLCFVFLTIAECITPEQKAQLMAINKECTAQTGVSDDIVLKAMEGEFSDDPKFKDHVYCVSKKVGFQNEAGELQLDVIKEKVKMGVPDEAIYNEIISKCINQKSTPEDTALEMGKCMAAIKKL